MFQKIIYDGLVGHSFFRNFNVTYNLPEAEMIFSKFDNDIPEKIQKYEIVNFC